MAIKAMEKKEKGEDIWSDNISFPKSPRYVMEPDFPGVG